MKVKSVDIANCHTTNHNLFRHVFLAKLKRLQEERQAIIDVGGLESPINEDEWSTWSLRAGYPAQQGDSQQAEAHAQRVVAVEAVYAKKVRTLEFTVQTQSQEVSKLRKAYTDMYSFLT
ncbi:hypothetical protein PIB30_024912 [Stylosanthes scabra]|uniref:Uncharacterized protein n=1 Tax=Stylosanthes scabra TaxID=79078 RepID=A0ABU6TBU0_9FABA|nr:hypothetical protein [Stylosanthes scabra]